MQDLLVFVLSMHATQTRDEKARRVAEAAIALRVSEVSNACVVGGPVTGADGAPVRRNRHEH